MRLDQACWDGNASFGNGDMHLRSSFVSTEATPETVAAEAPDAVVVAIGAEPIVPHFEGLEETRWLIAKSSGQERVGTRLKGREEGH